MYEPFVSRRTEESQKCILFSQCQLSGSVYWMMYLTALHPKILCHHIESLPYEVHQYLHHYAKEREGQREGSQSLTLQRLGPLP